MSKLELGYLIREALRHALKQQDDLLKHRRVMDLLPVLQALAGFMRELEEWLSGKYHLNDRSKYFLAQSEEIEKLGDDISERIWEYAPVSLAPVFEKIRERRGQLKADTVDPLHLRAQFNNFRLGLLEQVAGARLLENNSDLGEEVERILLQYLERRLGNAVRVVRGGHIYDYEGNRSGQVDLIITPAEALGLCPAETGGGKYNVIVDQVIAAISVTSRLTPQGLRERWDGFQKMPAFKEKEKSHPSIKGHAWPLCYIVGAECDDLEALGGVWQDMAASADTICVPQMLLVLDSGYLVPGSACWPKPRWSRGTAVDIRSETGVYAGLGLAWLEAQIAGRNCVLGNRSFDWVQRLSEHLSKLELKDALPPTYDQRRNRFGMASFPIQGILSWGWDGRYVHNRLELSTICVGKTELIADMTLLDRSKPVVKEASLRRYEFEPRWFRIGLFAVKGDYCALEEWIDASDKERHSRRIAAFDGRTGEDVTARLTRPLAECAELAQLDPVLNPDSGPTQV